MGKKEKKKKNNKKFITTKNNINNFNFVNGELFMRMNYLFKLSEAVYKQNNINEGERDQPHNMKNSESNLLSSLYIAIMKDIAKRNAIRINKNIKKMVCQKCNNLLFKDNNSEIKFINKNGRKMLQMNCGTCSTVSEIIYF